MYPRSTPRRRHAVEYKAKTLAACNEPGASISAVALGHGLNANQVRKWRQGRQGRSLKHAGIGQSLGATAKASKAIARMLAADARSDRGPENARDQTCQCTSRTAKPSRHPQRAAPRHVTNLKHKRHVMTGTTLLNDAHVENISSSGGSGIALGCRCLRWRQFRHTIRDASAVGHRATEHV